jgi:hypothetical protein
MIAQLWMREKREPEMDVNSREFRRGTFPFIAVHSRLDTSHGLTPNGALQPCATDMIAQRGSCKREPEMNVYGREFGTGPLPFIPVHSRLDTSQGHTPKGAVHPRAHLHPSGYLWPPDQRTA